MPGSESKRRLPVVHSPGLFAMFLLFSGNVSLEWPGNSVLLSMKAPAGSGNRFRPAVPHGPRVCGGPESLAGIPITFVGVPDRAAGHPRRVTSAGVFLFAATNSPRCFRSERTARTRTNTPLFSSIFFRRPYSTICSMTGVRKVTTPGPPKRKFSRLWRICEGPFS